MLNYSRVHNENMFEAIFMSRLKMTEEKAQQSVNTILSHLYFPSLAISDTPDEKLHQTLLLLLDHSCLPGLDTSTRERLIIARRDISQVLLVREGYDLACIPR